MAVTWKLLLTLLALFIVSHCGAYEHNDIHKGPTSRVTKHSKDVRSGTDPSSIEKVHIVFMNHLDVGYDGILPDIGFVNTILNRYFQVYFPRAIAVSDQLSTGGYVETFTYTTHPWLVSMYLDCPPNLILAGVKLQCPNATQTAAFEMAVKSGHITWHGGPMNMQSEFLDESLLEFGLMMSQDLDKRFNITRNFRVYNQRDVPGLTQSVIPTLVKNGVDGVAVGVNPMTAPPAVPHNTVFRWRYGKDEVLATWHPGGYPNVPGSSPAKPGGLSADDCAMVPGHSEALCYAFRGDNDGPPKSVQEILGYYDILREEFPKAKLMASTMENFLEGVVPKKPQLPVVSKEVGDTWIMGVSSDPRKTAEYRAATRVMTKCLSTGSCRYDDSRVWNASRFLLKMAEHTWGLPSVYDTVNWTNSAFYKASSGANYKNCTLSWIEQREFFRLTLLALGNHSVVKDILNEISNTRPSEPDLTGYNRVEGHAETQCKTGGHNLTIAFSHEGALNSLMLDKQQWAGRSNSLGKFLYYSYNATDFGNFASVYDYNGVSAGFNKVNVTKNAQPTSRSWPVNMNAIYQNTNGGCDFWVHVNLLDKAPMIHYGAPLDIWIRYTARTSGTPGVDIDFTWFDKTSTRLPESLMFSFAPLPLPGHKYLMSKINYLVDPTNGVLNGSNYLHALDSDGLYFVNTTLATGIRMSSTDVALVSPITQQHGPMSYAMPLEPITDPIQGAAFNIYNNVWDTNFIFWYPYLKGDKDQRSRFSVDFILPGSPESAALKAKLQAMGG